MEKQAQGRAYVFGKNIDTDQIYPGRFVELTNIEDVAKHAMEGADPHFVNEFKKGDIIVASTNFGCGSSREHAVITLKAVGASALIAESFGRIFYRNAINLGVPVLVCPGIGTAVSQGDELTIDIQSGKIVNETKDTVIQAEPISEYIMNILSSGGIKPMISSQLKNRSY